MLLANERARSATRAFRAAIAACHEYKEAHLYLGCALVELVEYEVAYITCSRDVVMSMSSYVLY